MNSKLLEVFYKLKIFNQKINNNKLRFAEQAGGGEQTITIPDGSYDILELNAEISGLMGDASTAGLTYTFNYDEITNKLNMKIIFSF